MATTVFLVALLTAGAVWTVLNTGLDVAGAVAGATPSSGTSTSVTASTTTEASAKATSTTASATSSPTVSALVKAERALASCRTGVVLRERLAQAAAATARNWRAHTEAQQKLEQGTWTPAKAEAVWDTTTARGSDDTKRFRTAAAAVRNGSKATDCSSVAADTASTPLAKKGERCATRVKALAAAAASGAVLNTQWTAHLKMMADKPHTNDAEYHDRWVTMVAQAQAPLKRYAQASKTLSRTPACSA